MAGTLVVQTLQGPTSGANANKVIIPSGQTLDIDAWTPPAGTVLQVVQDSSTTTFTQASSNYAANGLSATITPSSTSNKILILVSGAMYMQNANHHVIATVFRGGVSSGTDLNTASSNYGMSEVYSSGGAIIANASISYLDSPATDVAVTYEVGVKVTNGGGVFPVNNGLCSITLMEIAG